MLLTVAITGIVAALTFSAVQLLFIAPFILQAEVYEDAAEASPSHKVRKPRQATITTSQIGNLRTVGNAGCLLSGRTC